MTIVLYDGSFQGLLTAIFEIYEYRLLQPAIYKINTASGSLFGEVHTVVTNPEKGNRVYKKLADKISKASLSQFYKTFLSELRDIENVLFRYLKYTLESKNSIDHDYSHPDVLMLQQTNQKVHREKHRMEAFVRFQLTKDELYYSIIQPDYNVLPLICKHFKDRYADQRWLIYDSIRKYGLYYDGEKVEEIEMNFSVSVNDQKNIAALYDEKEDLYQKLWQQYFSSVNIAARKNMKLHIQHMPKRYWKNLIEKQPVK